MPTPDFYEAYGAESISAVHDSIIVGGSIARSQAQLWGPLIINYDQNLNMKKAYIFEDSGITGYETTRINKRLSISLLQPLYSNTFSQVIGLARERESNSFKYVNSDSLSTYLFIIN